MNSTPQQRHVQRAHEPVCGVNKHSSELNVELNNILPLGYPLRRAQQTICVSVRQRFINKVSQPKHVLHAQPLTYECRPQQQAMQKRSDR